MNFTFHLSNVSYWETDQYETLSSMEIAELDKQGWPRLSWLPAMQRRRLSPFMKMALYCANKTAMGVDLPLCSVFSSRHGDLEQTSKMIQDLARQQMLSPTAFSLSVHNAVAGLFSIVTNNTQPTTTVSAGRGSLFMAMVEAYARSRAQSVPVMVVHVDHLVPDLYEEYVDEQQVSHALAFIINASFDQIPNVQVSQKHNPVYQPEEGTTATPVSVQFAQWWRNADKAKVVPIPAMAWKLEKLQ